MGIPEVHKKEIIAPSTCILTLKSQFEADLFRCFDRYGVTISLIQQQVLENNKPIIKRFIVKKLAKVFFTDVPIAELLTYSFNEEEGTGEVIIRAFSEFGLFDQFMYIVKVKYKKIKFVLIKN